MGFFQVNGVVKWGPVMPEFKTFLKDMAAWFKEGLIDLDWVNMDTKLRDAKITGSQLGSWVAYTGSGIGYFAGLMAGKEPASFKLVGVPYPVMKKGDPVHLSQKDPNSPGGNTAAITTACKNVKEVMQLLDYAFSYDGHILYNFGVEGISFNWVNGFPKYTDIVVKNPQYPLAVAMARHFRSNFAGPFVQDYRYFTQYLTLTEQLAAVETWSKPVNDWWMPPITPNAEESKQFNKIMTDVNTLFSEQFAKTITGDVPVDNWDKTVAQFKQFGMDDAVKLRQAALDRYNKR
jgi:putative aldouronate transport system substrate-binding protein